MRNHVVSEDRRRLFGHQGLGGIFGEGFDGGLGELAGDGDGEDVHWAFEGTRHISQLTTEEEYGL